VSEYGADILIRSERQAELLRHVSAGQPVNEQPDWSNIIEELADVGRSELRCCRSLLRQALRHMLRAEAWPLSRDAPTWRADAINLRRQARGVFTSSIRQRIDLPHRYQDALRAMPGTIDGRPLPVPDVCPLTLDNPLGED
jgi:hypothetical protein